MRVGLRFGVLLASILAAGPVAAQYAEVPKALPVPATALAGSRFAGAYTAAVQIGRRLIVAGTFNALATPTGSAVVVDPSGHYVPGAFPTFSGAVTQIVADNVGGWLVAGDFTSVDGQPTARLVRVAPDRRVDGRYRVFADAAIRRVAIAHGRIYLAGAFTSINGSVRRGLAALDAATGHLTAWGAGFDSRGGVRELSISSLGVYVAGGDNLGHVWGLDAATGRVLFDRPGFASAIAASSARVYLGAAGAQRPVWAVDPLTGDDDTSWDPGLRFEYLPVTYGWDGTQVTALLLDGGRLYIGGRFRTSDGRTSLAAVETGGGAASSWRPQTPGPSGNPQVSLSRVGPAIVASFEYDLQAFDVATAARVPFQPDVLGPVNVVAPAPEGAVVGGRFNGTGGVARAGLASIDLDTYEIEPWTASSAFGIAETISELATDGTWLFGRTEGNLGGLDARVLKIDPVTGAVVGDRPFPSVVTRMRLAGGDLLVSSLTRYTQAGEVGVISIADWSYRALPVALDGWVTSLDVSGDTLYLGGRFSTLNGQSRPSLAAVHRVTGATLPWRPAPDTAGGVVRASAGRVWVAGDFSHVGGQRRRGLAEVDPATGLALAWNPDVAGFLSGNAIYGGVNAVEIGSDGNLYAILGSFLGSDDRAVAAGQLAPLTLAYSTASGRRLPWRPTSGGMVAVQPDCLLTIGGCLPAAVPAPTDPHVVQSGAAITLTWGLPPAPARSGVRLEVGRTAGGADLISFDLPANQQAFSVNAPAGSYFARVRGLAGTATSRTTPDVSFAVGVPAAPLDLTAIADGLRVTFAWQPPSTGAPARYELEAGTSEGQRDIGAVAVGGTATGLTVDVPVGTYWTRLVAVSDAGRSAPSNEALIDIRIRQTCSPSPPLNLAAAVSGRTVTLTWQPPADGSDDPPQIEAGSAPGTSDIGTVTAAPYTTSFSMAAPPGTYYVRLRVGCFSTATSNEVQVVVP